MSSCSQTGNWEEVGPIWADTTSKICSQAWRHHRSGAAWKRWFWTPVKSTYIWHKATSTQRRKLVIAEVRQQKEAERCAKAVSQAKQGQWTRWENVEHRKLTWRDLWDMEEGRLSFIIRATYGVLPTPKNLNQWFGDDPTCPLCQTPATLKHILISCKRPLYLEAQPARRESNLLDTAQDWKMQVDLEQKLTFPPEIITTNLRPDLILWSTSQESLYILELTVPWEAAVGEYKCKRLKYSDIAAEAVQRGRRTQVLPVEVGCRGFVARSTTRLLKGMGVRGQALRQAVRSLSEAAEQSSNWLWLKRTPPGLQDDHQPARG
ncbi:hypothetical protein SKAU_G00098090 [Synaphobranchus kaupii]|uniref:Reverse transcriptase zinc-binding domain-containing protein n=1 Tax=Synaphobranchus kaupii TaxID=118154 RepID=A0A9Q1J747_SYNKA|nr:hypothetical protein SKAU_G00098090 [Synaphobranchus kaupii]